MRKISLSVPSERLIGFTVPDDGAFLVCDHDEVWQVRVAASPLIQPTDFAPYEVAEQPNFVGWGREDAEPVTRMGSSAISYDFDPSADAVQIKYTIAGADGQIDFPIFSGDWFCASLSREGDLLVLAEPYRLDLYVVE